MTDGLTCFEDFHVGEERTLGSKTVTREAIIAFASEFDPQPFHLDDAAANASPYGGLIASGWHTASIAMRLLVDSFNGRAASLGSPGTDELRWLKPVRPGDTLTLKTRILAVTPSTSRPDRGSVRVHYTLLNQRGETVLTMIGIGMFARRPKGL